MGAPTGPVVVGQGRVAVKGVHQGTHVHRTAGPRRLGAGEVRAQRVLREPLRLAIPPAPPRHRPQRGVVGEQADTGGLDPEELHGVVDHDLAHLLRRDGVGQLTRHFLQKGEPGQGIGRIRQLGDLFGQHHLERSGRDGLFVPRERPQLVHDRLDVPPAEDAVYRGWRQGEQVR